PVTPKSSLALELTLASVLQKFVLAYFHFSPLNAPGMPLISFGSAMQPGGFAPDTSQRLGLAANGNSACAAGATPRTHAKMSRTSSTRTDRCMKGLLAMGIATRRGPGRSRNWVTRRIEEVRRGDNRRNLGLRAGRAGRARRKGREMRPRRVGSGPAASRTPREAGADDYPQRGRAAPISRDGRAALPSRRGPAPAPVPAPRARSARSGGR